MSWENELKEEIEFLSPNFNLFTAKWIGGERSGEKKLGIFDTPNADGSIVQDLGTKSTRYSITCYFDGLFHNSTAKDFYDALSEEKGQWQIIHPVKGPLILQLSSFRELIEPINDGNYTTFETEWLVPANIERFLTPDALASSILSDALILIEDSLLVLQQLRADIYSAVQSAINTFNKIAGFMDKIIAELSATDALLQESYLAAKAAFDSALDNFGVDNSDPSDVGTSMIDMSSATVDSSTDFVERFNAYESVIEETLTLAPGMTTPDDYNTVVTQEFGITVALISIAQTVATSEFQTRSQVIQAMDYITDLLNNTISSLDEIQDIFSTLDIDFQYFSQTQTYTTLINLYALCMQYLISQFYNLSVEKRFTLKNARSPLEITVTEYGELGEDDLFYNLFIESNNLSGNDILLLPAGHEVVIYG